jgi:hypothetical protein
MSRDPRPLLASLSFAVILSACGSTPTGYTTSGESGDGGRHDAASIPNLNGPKLTTLNIDPKTASIESLNGAVVNQAFKVSASYSNGTTLPIDASAVSWQATGLGVGSIDASGVFTATGALGGVVSVTAAVMGQAASASLTVKLHLVQNPASATGSIETTLEGATKADASVVWSYPYDGTAWPRELEPPTLMWNGGAATDIYYVRIESATFELEEFSTAPPPAQLIPDTTTWNNFTDSTTGPTSFHVARYDGTAATVIADQTWTIAPSTTRGAIY